MSRYYQMDFHIENHDPKRKDAIADVLDEVWSVESVDEYKGTLDANGEDSLTGGETEAEFADRVTAAIWFANKGVCVVRVTATCLEYLPCEDYTRGPEDEQRIKELYAEEFAKPEVPEVPE